MSYDEIMKDGRGRMEKALSHLKDQMRAVRTGLASPAMVENIRVDYYGSPTPISQLGAISTPEPRMIAIKPFDASILEEMSKAIMKSDIGINPQSDGKILRLALPPLSGDQRKKIAAKVKDICEETRIAMRNARRDLNKAGDVAKKDGDLTEDDNRALHDEVQGLLKEYESKVASIQEKKSAEVLAV
jgi:ribosome recycling factor